MAKKLKIIKVTQGDQEIEVAEVRNGKVVCFDDEKNNQEFEVDAVQSAENISRLNGEARGHRSEKERLEGELKKFEGIDPEKARTAIETVDNLSSGELLAANKVEEIKAQVKKQVEEGYKGKVTQLETKVQEYEGTVTKLSGSLAHEKVSNAFANSKYIKDKMAVTPAVAKAVFGGQFKVEEDKLVAYDAHGTKIYSNAEGKDPNFDEALEIIVGAYPDRTSLLKGTGNSGGGGEGNGNGGRDNLDANTITRKAFDAMDPGAKALAMRKGQKVVD